MISIVKKWGHTISIDVNETSVFDYELFIGKRYSFRLDGIIEKEKIVDLLAGHVRHKRMDRRFLYSVSFSTIAVGISVLVLFVAARLLFPEILNSLVWVLDAAVSAVAIALLAQTIWNVAMK